MTSRGKMFYIKLKFLDMKKEKVYAVWVKYLLINLFPKGRMGNYFFIVLDKREFLM